MMFAKYQELKDGDFDNLNDSIVELQQNKRVQTTIGGQKMNIDITNFIEMKPSNPVESRSTKNKPGDFEISFEGNFMDAHISAFREKTKNFIEKSLNLQIIEDANFSNAQLFGIPLTKNELNIAKVDILSPNQRLQFQKDLECQEKLLEFLKAISKEVPSHISNELVYITFQVWEKYLEVRKSCLTQVEIQKIASNLTNELLDRKFEEGRIRYLNLEDAYEECVKSRETVQQNFHEFLEFYCSTIFLIIEGYFENPHNPQDEGKRERIDNAFQWEQQLCLSSGSDSSFGMPMKRFKFE